MNKRKNILISLLLFVPVGSVHGEVFRCERNGEVVFSDRPCGADAKVIQIDPGSDAGVGTVNMQVAINHYPVHGHDYKSMLRSKRENGPNGYGGLARWRIRYEYTTKKSMNDCKIDTVRTTIAGNILMPNWVDERSADQGLRRRWRRYYDALMRHEEGHIQHGRELALMVNARLLGLGSVPCNEMKTRAKSEFDRVYQNLLGRDQEYDARTNHGETQGASFRTIRE